MKQPQSIQVKKILILLFLLLPFLITQGCSQSRTSEVSLKIPEKAYLVIEEIAPFDDEKIAMDEFNKTPTEMNRKKLAMIREAYALSFAISGEKASDPEALQFALLYAESAAELDPENANYWLLTGQLFLKLRGSITAVAEAEECFNKVLSIDPNNTDAIILLAQTQMAIDLHQNAVNYFEDAIQKDITVISPSLMSALLISYIKSDQDERGTQFFSDLLADDPEMDTARISMAVLLNKQGKTDRAIEELEWIKKRAGASSDNKQYATELIELLTSLKAQE